MEKEYKMSQARKDELEQELNYLKTTRSDEVAEQIKIARGFGDLSENSEYDEAKNEQGKLYSRIAELEVILQHVVIVDESAASDSTPSAAPSTFRAAMARKPAIRSSALRSPIPMHGIISEESPFGKASWAPRKARRSWWKRPSATSVTPLRRLNAKEKEAWLNRRIPRPSRS